MEHHLVDGLVLSKVFLSEVKWESVWESSKETTMGVQWVHVKVDSRETEKVGWKVRSESWTEKLTEHVSEMMFEKWELRRVALKGSGKESYSGYL